MPPKTNGNADSGKDIVALCHLMVSSSDGFKIDAKKAATALGIAQPSNVPRKINSIIMPYGFEMKGGTIIAKDGDGPSSTPATPAKGAGSIDQATNEGKSPKTPKTPGSRKNKDASASKTKNTKGPVNKKRKVDVVAAEDPEVDANDGEADEEMEKDARGAKDEDVTED